MLSIKTPIVLAGIGLSLIIIFMAISKFGIPTISKLGDITGKSLTGFSTGITDFFNSFDVSQQTEEQRKEQEATEIFERQLEGKEQQAFDAGFDSVEEFERETDTNNIFNASLDELTRFNPPNIIGYGISSLNDGRGIEDTAKNRQTLYDILQGAGEQGITDVRDVDFSSFSINSKVEQSASTESREIDQSQNSTPQGTTSIQGIVVNQLDNEQEFEVFSADSSRSVTGIIRETPQDPTELQTDSEKNPTETASQRANRVFEETGDFVDSSRGASSFDNDFDFGSNTGSGSTVPAGSSEELSLAERLRIEAEKASQIFDSRGISNW